MSKFVSFESVPGLAEVVNLDPNRVRLFPTEKKRKLPPLPAENTPETYAALCAEITEVLRRAAAHDEGEVAVEIFRDEILPASLRGRTVPATVRMEVESFPGRVMTEQGLVVYLSPAAMFREKKRRGYPVRCAVMPVNRFLEFAGENRFGARLVTEDRRFDLTRTQFGYIRTGAAALFREEAVRLADEEAAVCDAFLEEKDRFCREGIRVFDGGHPFRPRLDLAAAVNSGLPDERRREYAARFLAQRDGRGGAVLVEAPEDDEMPRRLRGTFMPRITRAPGGNRPVITVYLFREALLGQMEKDKVHIRYFRYGGAWLADLAVSRRCGIRLVTASEELTVPFADLAPRPAPEGEERRGGPDLEGEAG